MWDGVFHAVSAFNTAGFALRADSVTVWAQDPLVILTISAAVITGGLRFPVLVELVRRYRFSLSWSLTTRCVLVLSPVLLLAGTVFFAALEWRNPAVFGDMGTGGKILGSFFQSTVTRTAGFNSVDIAELHPVTWFGFDVLMFVGGGPAGTAGGIKITTAAVLAAMAWTEITGGRAVNLFGRRIARDVHRQATTVVVLTLGVVYSATMTLMLLDPHLGLDRLLFEVVSAFATVGPSTGITGDLSDPSLCVIVLVMMVGRLGPVTLATALALQRRDLKYELPKERPLIG
ncbi:potassium transporter TrkG [Brevibacterium litoralis]|uniref:potassium transporter TrkG n=1 Tax=Brevibacterium litoralis TaxID=3138935 RepID=UPI0032EE235E